MLAQIEPGDLQSAAANCAAANQGESMEQILRDVDRLIVPALNALEPSFVLRLLRHFNFRARNFW